MDSDTFADRDALEGAGRSAGDAAAAGGDVGLETGPTVYLSYSARDVGWAKWLESRLNAFRTPADLVGLPGPLGATPERIGSVRRRRADATSLDQTDIDALDTSDALIVLCSPDSAVSETVNDEIKRFRSRLSDRAVAPLLVRVGDEGLEASFPLALRYEITPSGELAARPMEVRAADVRDTGDGRDLALAKILAGLIGVDADALFQRMQLQRRVAQKRWILGLGIFAGLCLLVALGSEIGRRGAEHQRALAETAAVAAASETARARNLECALALSIDTLDRAQAVGVEELSPLRDAVRRSLARTRAVAAIDIAPRRLTSRSTIAWRPGVDAALMTTADGRAMVWTEGAGAPRPFGALAGGAVEDVAAGRITGAAWRADGARLAVLRERAVEIWSGDGERRITRAALEGALSVAWADARDAAVVVVENVGVLALDAASGATTFVSPYTGRWGRGAAIAPRATASGQLRVAVGVSAEVVALLDVAPGVDAPPREIRRLTHPASVTDVVYDPSGRLLAVSLANGQIWIWDAEGTRRVQALNAHEGAATTVSFAPDGERLLTGSQSGSLAIWRVGAWSLETRLSGHRGPVVSTGWRHDGARVSSASLDGIARVWATGDPRSSTTWLRREGWIWNVAWPGETARLAATTDQQLMTAETTESPLRRIAISQQFLAGAAAVDAPLYAVVDDATVTVVDLSTGRVAFRETMTPQIGRPVSVALAPDGSAVAVGSLNGVFVWSLDGHERIFALLEPTVAVAFSPDARSLAHFSLTRAQISLVDLDRGESVAQFDGPPGDHGVWALSFSRRGDRLAAGSDAGLAFVWRVDAPGEPIVLDHGGAAVKAVAWSRGDARLATAADDGRVRIWRPEDGAREAVIEAHRGGVRSVAWSADGLRIATGGEDGTGRLYHADFGEIRRLAEAQIAAALTEAERAICLAGAVRPPQG